MNDTGRTSEIVVGMDGTEAAAVALIAAAEQSRASGVPLRIVYSWQLNATQNGAAGAALRTASTAHARARATRWVLNRLGDDETTLRWVLDLVEGPPTNSPEDAHEQHAHPVAS